MGWLELAMGVVTIITSILAWRGQRKAVEADRIKRENARLKVRYDRLRKAVQIDADIDALSDDELRERLQASPYRRQ